MEKLTLMKFLRNSHSSSRKIRHTFQLLFLISQVFTSSVGLATQVNCTDSIVQLANVSVENLEILNLKTERLEIRVMHMTDNDIADATSVWTNPETQKMSGDMVEPYMVRQLLSMGSRRLSEVQMNHQPFLNFGIYKDGKIVGMSQVASGQEASIYASGKGSSNEKWVSISYHLKPDAWGMGIATEAAARLVSFAFDSLKVKGIHAEAIRSNEGSQKVLKKLGFQELSYEDPTYFHYYLVRD